MSDNVHSEAHKSNVISNQPDSSFPTAFCNRFKCVIDSDDKSVSKIGKLFQDGSGVLLRRH